MILPPRSGSCLDVGGLRGATPSSRSELEEIPIIQGKKQWLCFARAAMKKYHVQGKRNPSKMVGVARGHQMAGTLKP